MKPTLLFLSAVLAGAAFLAGCAISNEGSAVARASSDLAEVSRSLAEPPPDLSAPARLDPLNDRARFLAGLPGNPHSPLADLRESPAYLQHAANMDALWNRAEGSRLGRIRSWRVMEMEDVANSATRLYYPFSGPDFLYANAFFPESDFYYLCGLEPIRPAPDLETMSMGELSSGLNGIYTSLGTVLNYSYFITKDMRVDLQSTRFQGVLPLLYVFMARTGHQIEGVNYVHLQGDGVIVPASVAGSNGVEIKFSRAGKQKTLYYFSSDLSNEGTGGYVRLMAAQGPGATFIKSASYLLHSGGFSVIRNGILNHSFAILEDDSGVPIRYLDTPDWKVSYYGNYTRVLDIFKEHYQTQLREIYLSGVAKPIDFDMGYAVNYLSTAVILARRTPGLVTE